MVLKPDDTKPSLAESIGSLTVADKVFNFDSNSFPVDAIARMSPQSAVHMQTCGNVRDHLVSSQDENDVLALYDSNHDMKITKDEFMTAHGEIGNSEDAFDFIQSVFIQSEALGKPTDEPLSSSIELGRFFRLNWGWREFLTSGGDIAYPWRITLENTIGSGDLTTDERTETFKKVNIVLSSLIVTLKDQKKYPSKLEMEQKLINCESNDAEGQVLIENCFSEVFYIGSKGSSDSVDSIFGSALAYPSNWKPNRDVYESKPLQVAMCLIVEGSLTYSDISEAMGCDTGSVSENIKMDEEDDTTKILAWSFGMLFVGSLLVLTYTFFFYLPHYAKKSMGGKDRIEQSGTTGLQQSV